MAVGRRSFVLALTLLLGAASGAGDTCAKDDPECQAKAENKFSVAGFLAEVDGLGREEARVERLKAVIQSHPEEPELLLALTKQYMAMFDRLHPKMRGIGEIELVQPAIEIYMRLLRLPSEKMTDEKHAEIGKILIAVNID
jgi:hypothetical protein